MTPISVALPGLGARHNLNALVIARRFDDPAWRAKAIDALARAIEAVPGSGGRVALPAVLGLRQHADVLAALQKRLPAAPFEMPLVPPSVPGTRLYAALRAALLRAGGRIQIGEMIERVEHDGRRVTAVVSAAAVRTYTVRTDALIIATGGIAGGGLVAERDGRLREVLLGSARRGSAGRRLARGRRLRSRGPSARDGRDTHRRRACGRWQPMGRSCSTTSA